MPARKPPPAAILHAPGSRSHSAYISGSVTIHYRWSYLFGMNLTAMRRMHRADGDWLICESPSGDAVAIPAWMTDPSTCAGFSLGPPLVSLSALRALRGFLHGLQPTAECVMPSGNTFPLECPDEATKKHQADTETVVLRARAKQQSDSSRSADRTRGGDQSGNRQITSTRGARQRRSLNRS